MSPVFNKIKNIPLMIFQIENYLKKIKINIEYPIEVSENYMEEKLKNLLYIMNFFNNSQRQVIKKTGKNEGKEV